VGGFVLGRFVVVFVLGRGFDVVGSGGLKHVCSDEEADGQVWCRERICNCELIC
jgi:hypothetical protein